MAKLICNFSHRLINLPILSWQNWFATSLTDKLICQYSHWQNWHGNWSANYTLQEKFLCQYSQGKTDLPSLEAKLIGHYSWGKIHLFTKAKPIWQVWKQNWFAKTQGQIDLPILSSQSWFVCLLFFFNSIKAKLICQDLLQNLFANTHKTKLIC